MLRSYFNLFPKLILPFSNPFHEHILHKHFVGCFRSVEPCSLDPIIIIFLLSPKMNQLKIHYYFPIIFFPYHDSAKHTPYTGDYLSCDVPTYIHNKQQEMATKAVKKHHVYYASQPPIPSYVFQLPCCILRRHIPF